MTAAAPKGRVAGNERSYRFNVLRADGTPTEYEFRMPSVTSVIKDVFGASFGGASYWGFKLGIASQYADDIEIESLYEEAKKGPWAPNRMKEKGGDRGTLAHDVAERLVLGTLTPEDVRAGEYDGYCQAAASWFVDHQPEIEYSIEAGECETERVLWSLLHQYSGTTDLRLMDEVIDYKTHKPAKDGPAYPEDLVQLDAYAMAYRELGHEINGNRVVLFKEDGTYEEDHRMVPPGTFLMVLDLWRRMKEIA